MAAIIISVVTQKGGTGKTTTVAAIGAAIREKGRRVLFVDLDPQGNLTASMAEIKGQTGGIYEVLIGKITAAAAVISTDQGDLIPATDWLMAYNAQGADELRHTLKPLRERYDYILIDCGPSLGPLTVNAVTAADYIVTPMRAEFFALGTIRQLADVIDAARVHGNQSLQIAGILITQYKGRTLLNKQMAEIIDKAAKLLKTRVFKAYISDSVKLGEAQAMRKSILQYAPKSKAAAEYKAVAAELLGITEHVKAGRK